MTATSTAVEAFKNLPLLPDDLVPAALRFIGRRLVRIGLGYDAAALAALVPRLRPRQATAARRGAESIENPRDRSAAIAVVLPLLSGARRAEALEKGLLLAVDDFNSEVVTGLADRVAAESAPAHAKLLASALRAAATSRLKVFSAIGSLAPALSAAGGAATLSDTVAAVEQVSRWWE